MRVVIISMAAGAVASYVRLLDELGHENAGVLTMRGRRRPEAAGDVVAAVPEGVDVVVVGSAGRVAPLLRSYDADVGVCGGWGWKLGGDALSATRLGIVNGHPSLLPRRQRWPAGQQRRVPVHDAESRRGTQSAPSFQPKPPHRPNMAS